MFILSTADPFIVRLYFTSTRGGKPAITIFSPSHILIIFSSEPPQNPRPFNIVFFKRLIFQDKTFF